MNLLLSLVSKYRQFILYAIIGGFSASIDFGIYTLMLYLAYGNNLLLANTVGVLCGIGTSFTLNRQFNFKVKDHTAQRFISFLMVGLLGLTISSIMLFALVDYMNWNKLWAKLLTIAVVSVIQFILNKTLTFKVKEQ